MILLTILSAIDLLPSFPLVLQILGPNVIDVVLFGDLVQSIDAWIAALQALLEFGARSHVLITGPVKFDARLGPPFLKVEAAGRFFLRVRVLLARVIILCPLERLEKSRSIPLENPQASVERFLYPFFRPHGE